MSDPIKQIASGKTNDVTSAVSAATETQANLERAQIFSRAVVVEVLDNLTLIDFDDSGVLEKYDNTVKNKADLRIAPRNSILANIVTDGKGKRETKQHVCFPFFSSHLSLPLKPGEQVWVMFETLKGSQERGYWLSRINEPIFVEDPNYTHGDRR